MVIFFISTFAFEFKKKKFNVQLKVSQHYLCVHQNDNTLSTEADNVENRNEPNNYLMHNSTE